MSNISTNLAWQGQMRIHLSECQSTNDYLHGLAAKGNIEEGTVVTADFQTAGKGQAGNVWESARGENLICSLFLRPGFLEARYAFWLSAAVAIGLAEALEPYVPDVKVKWPNDLFVNGKKLGGILIENTVVGSKLGQTIVGFGININQVKLPIAATSLYAEQLHTFSIEEILAGCISSIYLFYNQLRVFGWEKMRQRYYVRLYKMGLAQDYRSSDGQIFRAVLKGISADGELILITSGGEKRYRFKEVSLLGIG